MIQDNERRIDFAGLQMCEGRVHWFREKVANALSMGGSRTILFSLQLGSRNCLTPGLLLLWDHSGRNHVGQRPRSEGT